VFCTQEHTRLDRAAIATLGLPTDADAYLCGPTQFMADMRDALTAAGLNPAHIHSELFGALPSINPCIVDGAPRKPPHPPAGTPGTGPSITFARSGLTVNWSADYGTILDLAEACDVPTRFSSAQRLPRAISCWTSNETETLELSRNCALAAGRM
jgi:hypothetical protein